MLESGRSRGVSALWPLSRSQTASDLVMARLRSTISSVVACRLDSGVGQELLEQQIDVLEVELALLLRQHLRLERKNFLRRHVALPDLAAARGCDPLAFAFGLRALI